MSEFKGDRFCPQCGRSEWSLQDWETYLSVTCADCGYKAGELALGSGGLMPLPVHGRPVEVTRPVQRGPQPLLDGTVTVNRTDLEYLLAHYWDEVKGSPDRSHWRLQMLEQAALRLSEATRG